MQNRVETKNQVCESLRLQAKDPLLAAQTLDYAVQYMHSVYDRTVFPNDEAIRDMEIFTEALPDEPSDPQRILKQLHEKGSPATVAQTGGRYFGFVNGGLVPAGLYAKWLADVWDQNGAMYVSSPIVSQLEEVCESWLIDLLNLPKGTAIGFVSGSSIATLCGLAAGRNHLLSASGYDVAKRGLFGAPDIQVVLSEGAHSTIFKALSILGLGSERVIKVPMDDQGRMCTDQLPPLNSNTLLILQAGNVNTGAFDDFESLCERAHEMGAWVHVDGAFGLWAAACEPLRYLTKGLEKADSWSADGHKTLNAPYDNGLIFCRDRQALVGAMSMSGDYIQLSDRRDGMLYTPDMSRRGRSVELWATLKALGRSGVSELVFDLHDKAKYFSAQLAGRGFKIHNDVVFNQILVSADTDDQTKHLLSQLQSSGVMWCGGSLWKKQPVVRISVCSYQTTFRDIDLCVEAFIQARESISTMK